MVQFMEDSRPEPVEDAAARAAAGADAVAETGRAPWHLWVVGVGSLLWNCIGALDFTMSQLRNEAYLGSVSHGMGVTAAEMIAFIDSFPAWMHAFWALGVWGALAGSVLLLMRSRYAVWAFTGSLLGLGVTQLYQALTPQPAWMETATGTTIFIWAIAIGLLIYAVSVRKKGVLG